MPCYFFDSTEQVLRGRSDTQFASDLFLAFFNWAPEAGSLSFWVFRLDAVAPRDIAPPSGVPGSPVTSEASKAPG